MAWLTRNIRDSETGKISGKEIWLRFRSAFAVLLSVGVLVAGVGFAATRAQEMWQEFRTAEDYEGTGVDPIQVTIAKGTTLSQMADILVKNDVIKTAKAFDRAAAANADSKNISYGTYNLKTQLPAKAALNMLLDKGNLERKWMTLTEGARLSVQVQQMAKATKLPPEDFEAVLKKWKKMGLPKWAKGSAEGFLFPDTYELGQDPEAAAVIKQATDRFKKVLKDIDFEAAAKKAKVKPFDALIMASIIEREAGSADREKVARVIYNRLKKKMPLEMDSTVHYAVNKSGSAATTPEDRKVDSPYNTYRYKGLPPGPIAAPSKASLKAAVNPEDGDWLFFVTINLDTGETVFTTNNNDHEAAAAKYYAWCRESDANYFKCYGKER